MKNEKRAIALKAIFACLLWSTAFAGVKIGLSYTTPFFLAGIRFVISGLILIPFSSSGKKYFIKLWENKKLIFSVSALQTIIMYGLYFTGINIIPGSIAALIIGASPLITALVSHFSLRDDKFSKDKFFAIILGMAGIVFIVLGRQAFEPVDSTNVIGIFLLLASMVVSAFANIMVSKHKGQINPVLLNSYQLTFGGLILILISLSVEGIPIIVLSFEFILALGWLSFISAAAFSIWFSLLKKPDVKVSELNMWKFLIPVFGASISWILLPDESPTVIGIVGMVIITMSIILYYLPFGVSIIKKK
jgi:drug/metabolite transporter (DMT)-like permease